MAETVDIKPKMIRWAIDRSRLPMGDLVARFPKLEKWKSGDKKLTLRELESFAKKTMTPFGFLFLDEPPDEPLPIPDFRTVGDTPIDRPSPNLIDTIHAMQRRQVWMRDILTEGGHEARHFVGSAGVGENYKSLARKIRQELDLLPGWAESLPKWEDALGALRNAVERIGILVFSNGVVGQNNYRPLDPEEFRGFVLCDPYVPVVFINGADSKSAQIFTLAHELAHVWLGKDGLFNLVNTMPAANETERFCNLVAAEFLVPGNKLVERWPDAKATNRPFYAIAKWFKVSPIVAARRALDLELISKAAFFGFYNKQKEEWQQLKAKGGNFYSNQHDRLGRRFASFLFRAVREGRIAYRDAYRLTDLKGDAFSNYSALVLQRMKDERQ